MATPEERTREAEELSRRTFGLDPQRITPLPGDEEANFRVRCTDEREFLLRIYASGLARNEIEFQRDLLEHAAARDPWLVSRIQRFARTSIETVTFEGASVHAALLEYLPGRPMATVTPHSPELLRDLGVLLGRLDRALEDFEGARDHATTEEGPSWILVDGADTIEPRLAAIESGPLRRGLVERIAQRYREHVEPRSAQFRTGVVHQDANDYNVLVRVAPGRVSLGGLIDFGDATRTIIIAEVTVAAAYAALGKRDPVTAMGHVIAGYDSALPLTDEELDVVFDLALLRLATSVAISSQRAAAEGGASEYHLISQQPAWTALETLADLHPRLGTATLRAMCGREPLPRAATFAEWSRARSWSPVLDVDLAGARRIDLSLTSPLVMDGPRDASLEVIGARAEALRGEHPCTVGYHGEPRRLYGTDAFVVPTEDGSEPRTIHLGVDLFAPAGTAVFAPADGVVDGLARNDAPLDYGPTLILRHEGEEGRPFWTLYGHLDGEVLDRLHIGDRVRAGEAIARCGNEAENGGWPPHLHFQVILDRFGWTEGDFPGVAAPSQRDVWEALSPDPAPLLGLDSCAAPREHIDNLLAARRDAFCDSMSISYERPLALARGSGTTLFDAEGRHFVDAVNNVPHVGHCHPRVVEAGQRQMALLNSNTRYLNAAMHRYARKLRATLPDHLQVIYLVSSGSEANELALRLASAATDGARDVVVQEHGYHGHTGAALQCSHYKFARSGGFPKPDHVHVVPVPDPRAGLHHGADSGPAYVAEVERVIEAIGRRPAALLAEAILGCGGQVVPPDGYLAGAFDAIRRAGGVAIADEVQVGFGRVGTHYWAFDEQGAVPDIVTMGKPMGNGHPVAAVATTREIADSFASGMEFFATFGGNHVSVAIAEAVLDVIEDEGLLERATRSGDAFRKAMEPVAAKYPRVTDVRGRGLYLGVELTEPATNEPLGAVARYVANRMRDRGFLISTDGPHGNVLKIKPPIVIEPETMRSLVEALDRTLGETAATD